MLVMNELKVAEDAIEKSDLGDRPSSTLTSVAKYYKKIGLGRLDIRNKLESFLVRCDKNASVVKWGSVIEHAISRADKYALISVDHVDITRQEMDVIEAVSGVQTQRLAFTLLAISKYQDIVNENNNQWVSVRDVDIMRMANINTSIRRQSKMYADLYDSGLIQFSKRIDNTNVRVLFATSGDAAIQITDMRNLGYQYLKTKQDGFFECEMCGVTEKIKNPGKGRPQKYCLSCAIEMKTVQSVNSVMRSRTRLNQ